MPRGTGRLPVSGGDGGAAAIRADAGQAIDREIFKPKGRQGPRLAELAVQTSSYGTPIQQVFGTMRIGGCVIWATDLIESKAKSSGGKGQPSTTNYSYSVSFAVALSGRAIAGIGRIWADGKLLRGAAGDFKTETDFRLHAGSEDQAVDPLIGSAEGAGLAPAHRGIAYAVFEHFQLAEYGNRIPSLTFEVIGDVGPVAAGVIAEAVSDGLIDGAAVTLPLAGFSAYGDSVRAVAEVLGVAAGAWFAPVGARLVMRADPAPTGMIADAGVSVAGMGTGSRAGGSRRSVAALETVPGEVTLAHYDPARDYQMGTQRARRPHALAGGRMRAERIDMPAVLDASAAKTMAEAALARGEAARERRSVALGWDALPVAPGACLTIADALGRQEQGIWRVTAWSLEQMVLTLECVRLAATTAPASATPGRVASAPDLVAGTTILHAFESLPLDDALLGQPRLTVAAAGTAPGWRRAALLYSIDDGASWTSAGSTAASAVTGTLVSVPWAAGAAIVDRASVFEVELAHGEMALVGADDVSLDGGANLALVGDELLQFGVAEQVSATRWRLSRLLRGRRATEAAIGGQTAGARFVLVDPDAVVAVDLPLGAIGGGVRVIASGVGDVAGPATSTVMLGGASVVPPSPVHLTTSEVGDGDVAVQWLRRGRTGWRWRDNIDTPLSEERERYRVTIAPIGGAVRTFETEEPQCRVALAERVNGARIEIRQIGSCGLSRAASNDLPAWGN